MFYPGLAGKKARSLSGIRVSGVVMELERSAVGVELGWSRISADQGGKTRATPMRWVALFWRVGGGGETQNV